MADISHHFPYSTHKKYNLHLHIRNTSKYGDKSLRVLLALIWNSRPDSVKHKTSMKIFKGYIKTWFGPKFKCYLCGNLATVVFLSIYCILSRTFLLQVNI